MSRANSYIPHYTIADYEQWDGDWELWNGVPVAMTPSPAQDHQRVARRLLQQFIEQLERQDDCPCEPFYEWDWHVGNDTVVKPDLVIVCEPIPGKFLDRPPALIAEVLSPATAGKDRVAKRRLYAEQGVTWYLIADPQTRTLDVLRLAGNEYQPAPAPGIDLHVGCTLTIDASRLWS